MVTSVSVGSLFVAVCNYIRIHTRISTRVLHTYSYSTAHILCRPQICIGGEVPDSYFQDPHEVEKLVMHGRRLSVRRAGKYEHRIDVHRPATEIR